MIKQLCSKTVLFIFLLISFHANSQSPTDPALGFNIFLKNGATFISNETDGPVAMGGDVTIAGNYQANTHNVGSFSINNVPIGLFVGGKVIFQSGSLQVNSTRYVKIGNCTGSNLRVWYKDNNGASSNIYITPAASNYASTPNININANANSWGTNVSESSNPVCDANVSTAIDFSTAFSTMQATSSSISACSVTGVKLTNPNGDFQATTITNILNHTPGGQVKISLNSGTNVLNVTGAELNSVTNGITFNNAPDASHILVINVNASGNFSWTVWNQAGLNGSNSYILYNFYNTTQLNIVGSNQIEGTVFAPFADINKTNTNNIEGQVIAQSYYQNGGENHYYNFTPSVTGCGGCTLPTVAAITGNTTVCNGLTTTLSDITAGGVWSTSNAAIATVTDGVVTGVEAGTVTINYAVTNSCGTTKVSQLVTVNAIPSAPAITVVNNCDGSSDLTATNYTGTLLWSNNANTATIHVTHAAVYTVTQTIDGCTSIAANGTAAPKTITVADTIMGIASTCAGYTTILTDSTPGGVWSSDNTAIATIDNNGTVTGMAAGTANIIYTVNGTCGSNSATVAVTINSCGGGVTGGSTGGLESKSLGDAIAKRIYNKAVSNAQGPAVYSANTAIVPKDVSRINTMGTGTTLTLSDILPQQLTSYNLKSYLSTPTDITSITNATNVLSIDYTLNNQAKAVAFATQTSGEVYDHTKAVCDRLKGSQLVDIKNIIINNLKTVLFTLNTADSITEYAMSFVIGANSARKSYTFQSNWLNKDYTSDETMYNIQLWAVSPELVVEMANKVISNLQASMPVQYINNQTTLPDSYIIAGKRENTNLSITINNQLPVTSGYFELKENANEQSAVTTRTIPFTMNANGNTSVSLPMSDTYQSTIDLFVNGKLQDEVYMADGTWSYNASSTSTVNSFTITNETARVYADDELPIFRKVQIKGTSTDYVTVYKLLKGGGMIQDLTGYKTLKFTASGGYNLRITLVKNSIVNWKDQYNVLVPLSAGSKDYFLSLNSLVSSASANKIQPNDITTIVFSIETGAGQNYVNTSLSNISFTNQDAGFMQMMAAKEILLYPNPARSQFTCTFKSDKTQSLTLRIIDAATGSVVMNKQVNAVTGINNISVDLNKSTRGNALYFISLEGDNLQYKTVKLMVDNK